MKKLEIKGLDYLYLDITKTISQERFSFFNISKLFIMLTHLKYIKIKF